MRTYKTDIPSNSLTRQYLPVDYTDAFACEADNALKLPADEIMIRFWTTSPTWVNALFKLRNALVRPFGLEAGEKDRTSEALREMILSGNGKNGLMSVTDKSSNETVVLLSDKHLDAYMAVYTDETGSGNTVTVITLVRYRKLLGKIYFFFIRPFHKVIVKSMLKSILTEQII